MESNSTPVGHTCTGTKTWVSGPFFLYFYYPQGLWVSSIELARSRNPWNPMPSHSRCMQIQRCI